ncbi:MAG TPA: hypothetical protein VH542_10230 [Steroidobacteraceae bacterium]|jgi:hypothetical protein
MRQEFPGRFEVTDVRAPRGSVRLERRARRDAPAVEVLFARVTRHDLPERLDNLAVDTEASDSGFLLRSGAANYHVAARSVQIHEGARIYDRLPLGRFALSQRLLWSLLLWSARYSWGQALIRRLRR